MACTLENVLFKHNDNWHMQFSERAAVYHIMSVLKPDVSLEIGTFMCGSLHPIAEASKSVYTFDIDDRRQDGFENVDFIQGSSHETVPPIIASINTSDRDINFILVDGAHDTAGVHADLVNCLAYRPKNGPTIILMHDSANPDVRAGIKQVEWGAYPHVHMLDLDFVPGMLYDRSDIRGQIWGGLAVAVMLPEIRINPISLSSNFQHSLDVLMSRSVYSEKTP